MLLHLATVAALLSGPPQDSPPADVAAAAARAPALLDHAALAGRLRMLASEHPDVATLLLLGRSRGGRELLGLRLAQGELEAGRPAILVVANLDGPQVDSSALALWQIEELLARSADDEEVRSLLASTTLYVVPRANPDPAELRFTAPRQEAEASGHGVDDDRDGRQGEDPVADLDGDGAITWMRVPDPEGTWMPDEADPRATVEADRSKGQHGRWRLVREGRDLDGDGLAAEDGPLNAVVNENFASGWREHDPRAGRFPMDEPEARALADFVIEHTDIALVLTYGALDNLVEAPRSVKEPEGGGRRRFGGGPPEPGWLESDAALLAELARRRKQATGREPRGAAGGEGSLQAWAYDHRGLFSLAAALWDLPTEASSDQDASEEGAAQGEAPAPPRGPRGGSGDEAGGEEAQRLAWCDANGEQARFKPWTAFEHPELGPVEIGGWMPYARIEPPAQTRLEIAQGELAFLLSLGAHLPRVGVVDAQARALADGLVEVTAALENPALLPLRSAAARRSGTVRPARVELLLPEGATLVAGERQILVGELEGAGGRRELRWLVAGPRLGSVGIVLDTDHAGAARIAVEVQR